MNKEFDRIAAYEKEKKELSNIAKVLKDKDKLTEAGGELPNLMEKDTGINLFLNQIQLES